MAQAKLIDISAPGEKMSEEDARPLREEVARLLGRSQKGFPGAQPVSFSRKHIGELMKQECVSPLPPSSPTPRRAVFTQGDLEIEFGHGIVR